MIRVGLIGATGYAGAELVRILLAHPEAEIVWYGSRSYVGQAYSEVYPGFRGLADVPCRDDDLAALAEEADVIFTATPQGYLASVLTEEILERTRVIDLSADFRIKDPAVYEKWYGIEHKAKGLIPRAVYGLCEINGEAVGKTRLVANPGCYTTCSILAAWPLVREGLIDHRTLIIDAKSGVTGAGRGAKVANLFCEVNDSIKPYGVCTHRHTPEIEEQLSYAAGESVTLSFTPHLVPMERGILATSYASLRAGAEGRLPAAEEIRAAYEKWYGDKPFIRLLPEGKAPETRCVKGSNLVDIGFAVDPRTGRVVMMSALDNLVKGAAGQAVQNMNLMFGLAEDMGLPKLPVMF